MMANNYAILDGSPVGDMIIAVPDREQTGSFERDRLRRLDVTDDRSAAESFHLLFESSPVPMWVVERSSLKFLAVNAAAVEHYGYARGQFLNMTSLDIRPACERQRALDDARNNFTRDSGEKDWIHNK